MALAAGASWGTTSLSARYLVDRRELFPTHVVFWRFLLAVPFLLAAWAIWGRGQRRFEWKDLPEIAGLALLGITAMANFNFYSAKYTTNINSTIIITASAVIIAVIAWFQGAPVRRGQWAGVLLGLAGVGFIAMAKDQRHTDLTVWQHSMGITFAFLASVSWALYTVLGRRMVEKYGGLEDNGLGDMHRGGDTDAGGAGRGRRQRDEGILARRLGGPAVAGPRADGAGVYDMVHGLEVHRRNDRRDGTIREPGDKRATGLVVAEREHPMAPFGRRGVNLCRA